MLLRSCYPARSTFDAAEGAVVCEVRKAKFSEAGTQNGPATPMVAGPSCSRGVIQRAAAAPLPSTGQSACSDHWVNDGTYTWTSG